MEQRSTALLLWRFPGKAEVTGLAFRRAISFLGLNLSPSLPWRWTRNSQEIFLQLCASESIPRDRVLARFDKFSKPPASRLDFSARRQSLFLCEHEACSHNTVLRLQSSRTPDSQRWGVSYSTLLCVMKMTAAARAASRGNSVCYQA